jgi:hypothetical protein
MLCLNISAFILHESGAFTGSRTYAETPGTIESMFSWSNLISSLGVAGGVGAVIATIFGFSAAILGSLIIWALVSFAPVITWFFKGVPLMLEAMLPPELWFVRLGVEALFAVVFFMFIIEQAGQRQIT